MTSVKKNDNHLVSKFVLHSQCDFNILNKFFLHIFTPNTSLSFPQFPVNLKLDTPSSQVYTEVKKNCISFTVPDLQTAVSTGIKSEPTCGKNMMNETDLALPPCLMEIFPRGLSSSSWTSRMSSGLMPYLPATGGQEILKARHSMWNQFHPSTIVNVLMLTVLEFVQL